MQNIMESVSAEFSAAHHTDEEDNHGQMGSINCVWNPN
jgi:hypothetical protein